MILQIVIILWHYWTTVLKAEEIPFLYLFPYSKYCKITTAIFYAEILFLLLPTFQFLFFHYLESNKENYLCVKFCYVLYWNSFFIPKRYRKFTLTFSFIWFNWYFNHTFFVRMHEQIYGNSDVNYDFAEINLKHSQIILK